jgi:hypothetical protein
MRLRATCVLLLLVSCNNSTPPPPPANCGGVCGAGTVCAAGKCVAKDCPTNTCGSGEACLGTRCQSLKCASVTCGSGTACTATGECLPTSCAGVLCPSGTVCSDGSCVDQRCAGVLCPAGQACSGGECLSTRCAFGACPAGSVCSDNACVDTSCVGVLCGAGESCDRGACTAMCPAHAAFSDDFGAPSVGSDWSPAGSMQMGGLAYVLAPPMTGGNNGFCMGSPVDFTNAQVWVRIVTLAPGDANVVTYMTVANVAWDTEAALDIHTDGTMVTRKTTNNTTEAPQTLAMKFTPGMFLRLRDQSGTLSFEVTDDPRHLGTVVVSYPASDVFPNGDVSQVEFHFGIRGAGGTNDAVFDDFNVCP